MECGDGSRVLSFAGRVEHHEGSHISSYGGSGE